MTPPTAERLRELRLHHTGCPDMCPDAELLAALDYVAARLAAAFVPCDPCEECKHGDCEVYREIIAYIGAPS